MLRFQRRSDPIYEEFAMSTSPSQEAYLHESRERDREAYEDLLWGFHNVEMWTKYEETGGVFAIFQKKVVAEGLDLETVLREVERQGLSRADVAVVAVPSPAFP